MVYKRAVLWYNNMEPVKKPFKINILGLIRLEPDNMTTKEIVLVMA